MNVSFNEFYFYESMRVPYGEHTITDLTRIRSPDILFMDRSDYSLFFQSWAQKTL